MKYTLLIVTLCLASYGSVAQSDEMIIAGKVKEMASGKSIKAKITYRSIPTGGIYGSFYDSLFQFSIFGSSKYEVAVTADGYIPRMILIDPRSFEKQQKIVRDVLLTPKDQPVRLETLLFEQQKSAIDRESLPGLDELAAMMKENPKIVIQLEGHTDNTGSAKANMDLSQARVDAVKKYLVSKGVEKSRVKTKAFGGTMPVTNEKTPDARNLNRRVELRVLSDN